ncbi:hypothetical protein SLE2022_193350 [Rubroshorea leprosula]
MEEDKAIQTLEDQSSPPSFCLSFNCYSSGKLVDVANRVRLEFDSSDFPEVSSSKLPLEDELDGGNGDDFEFVSVRVDHGASSSFESFPIFNRDFLSDVDEQNQDRKRESREGGDVASSVLIPLRNLFMEDRDPPSSSSSEKDEEEEVISGTYCLWTPKREVESSPSRCKKSKSTGSFSKRWPRLRDLLRRSNSDSKDSSLVFLNHSQNSVTKKQEDKKTEKQGSSQVKVKRGGKASAHEVFYVRNRASKESGRRSSYLPYRQDLVGFFTNVNGLGRTFAPF